jgi:hypothetical protein
VYLCDLAGSEKITKTGAEGQRLKEASKINTSLLALRKVIDMLAQAATSKVQECPHGSRCIKQHMSREAKHAQCQFRHTHIPYRDSKLTRLLQNALGGQGRAAVICTVNPKKTEAEETLSTLRFGTAAASVENSVVANVRQRSHAEWTAMISIKNQLIHELRHEVLRMHREFGAESEFPEIVARTEGAANEASSQGGARGEQEQRPKSKSRTLPATPHVCGITGRAMLDPVVASDGHTYDRIAITGHLRTVRVFRQEFTLEDAR